MAFRIVSDSACDLPAEVVEEYGIEVLPLYINMEGKSLRDGMDISRADFYSQLPNLPTHPTTSTPGVELIRAKYEELIKKGATGIISIHIAGALSNMVNLAQLAAKSIKGVPVRIIDSGQISLGIGLQVLDCCQGKPERKSNSRNRRPMQRYAKTNLVLCCFKHARIYPPRWSNIEPSIQYWQVPQYQAVDHHARWGVEIRAGDHFQKLDPSDHFHPGGDQTAGTGCLPAHHRGRAPA